MASEQEITARLNELSAELQIVYKQTDAIAKCATDMYKKISEEIYPSYGVFQNYWYGSTSNSYLEKTVATLNDTASNCSNMRAAAVEIMSDYLEYLRQEIIKLGLKPKDVLPDVYKE